MRKIFLETSVRKELARYFGCTLQMVGQALNGRSESELALRIRDAAIRAGGVRLPLRKPADTAALSKLYQDMKETV
jgi:hypothetical protein